MILADTSVWIPYARRHWDLPEVAALRALLAEREVALTGMILAEVLQGARQDEGRELRDLLLSLPFLDDNREAWFEAGRLASLLERRGMRTPLSDIVIGMVAVAHQVQVLARDNHFERIPGVTLYTPNGERP